MSLSVAQKVESVNMATKKAVDAGIHVVVAAGNSAVDACNVSPASTPGAITVGATENESDEITNFSNRGPCLDIFAPGRNIMSAGSKSPVDVSVLSGTSFSSPHVAGAIALIISKRGNLSPAKMTQELLKQSTKGVVKGLDRKTPNNFLRVEKP
jgi:subtilisin family serine protease